MPTAATVPDHSGRIIQAEIVTRAPAARVWDAWADPERIVEWFAEGALGRFSMGERVTWKFDRLRTEMAFRVLVANAPDRFLLESLGEVPTRLEVLLDRGHEGTRVKLVHSGFPDTPQWNDDVDATSSGWSLALSVLRYYAEFHFGQRRESFFVSRPAIFSLEKLARLYHEPSGLQEWLTDGGSLGTPGGRVHLALKSGEMLRGDMLADTGVELAMAWDEIAGVLELKTFPFPQIPGHRELCVLGWGWGIPAERARRIERDMTDALNLLERVVENGEPARQDSGVKT